jgi:hypothetical protein
MHSTNPTFWECYNALPAQVREVADRQFEILKADPSHPSLHLKRVGRMWSVRAGLGFRALGVDVEGGIQWFWIGSHAEYERLITG